MQNTKKSILAVASLASFALFLLGSFRGIAQEKHEKPKPELFQAQATGESTQMGQSFNVTVNIADYSTVEEPGPLVLDRSRKQLHGCATNGSSADR